MTQQEPVGKLERRSHGHEALTLGVECAREDPPGGGEPADLAHARREPLAEEEQGRQPEGQSSEQVGQPVDPALSARARRGDRPARVPAGAAKPLAQLASDHGDPPHRSGRGVEALLHGGSGVPHTTSEAGELVHAVVDPESEPGEEDQGEENGRVAGDGGPKRGGGGGIEAHRRIVARGREAPDRPVEDDAGVIARRYDIIIVGMGSGGMVAAEFAATLDVKVAVVERGRVGGDCLWTGCVPSKALLASAKAAHTMRHADFYGLAPVEPEIDTARVWERIRSIQEQIAASDDDPERFRAMGVDVLSGSARLTGPSTVEVDGEPLEARFVLLCTGSRPLTLPIDGLREAGFLSSENVFELERAPRSLTIIGGGPIAIEMAQAFARLGTETTVLEQADGILARDEPELVKRLATKLEREGVRIQTGVEAQRVTVEEGEKVVHGIHAGRPTSWRAEEILLGAGRAPNVEGLGLEELGVELGPRGVQTDERLRTSVGSIYVAGDVAGRFLFTHSAGFEAVRAVRNMFFPGSSKGDYAVPWCTFTDPELAHAGLTVAQAEEEHGAGAVEVFRQQLSHSDRARAESAEEGAILLVTAKKRLVGAHVLAPGAGELIHELALAMNQKLKLADLANLIHVYPTIAIGVAQLAAEAAFESAQKFSFLVRSEA